MYKYRYLYTYSFLQPSYKYWFSSGVHMYGPFDRHIAATWGFGDGGDVPHDSPWWYHQTTCVCELASSMPGKHVEHDTDK